MNLKMTNQNN